MNKRAWRRSDTSKPIDHVHPDLLDLMHRTNTVPPGDLSTLAESDIAHAVSLALTLAGDRDQVTLVSRIMSDQELAAQRLLRLDVQDLNQYVLFTSEERRLILARPTDSEEDHGGSRRDECIVCGNAGTERLPCGCDWCISCLGECIRVGLRSEISFPPRCCQPIGGRAVHLTRDPALIHLFRQLSVEFSTPAAERVHCHAPHCGAFIPGATAGREGVATCELCGRGTCMLCAARAHQGLPCTEERGEEVWRMMDDNGLVGCPQCGLVVSLSDGCNHMTCLCRAQFCYICGQSWDRECNCPQYGGLEQRVPVRMRPGRKPVARGRASLVVQEDEMLRIPQLRDSVVPEHRAAPDRHEIHSLPIRPAAPAVRQGPPPGDRQPAHPTGAGAHDGPEDHAMGTPGGGAGSWTVNDRHEHDDSAILVAANPEPVSGVAEVVWDPADGPKYQLPERLGRLTPRSRGWDAALVRWWNGDQDGDYMTASRQRIQEMADEIRAHVQDMNTKVEQPVGRPEVAHHAPRPDHRHNQRPPRSGWYYCHNCRGYHIVSKDHAVIPQLLKYEKNAEAVGQERRLEYTADWAADRFAEAERDLDNIMEANVSRRRREKMLERALERNPLFDLAMDGQGVELQKGGERQGIRHKSHKGR